jgi:hypothetical protein
MKPIKITESNKAAIEAALKEVNGTASAHTYTDFFEIENLAEAAEKQLEAVHVVKAKRAGAKWTETSGGAVAKAYSKKGGTRIATRVTIERRSAGWYLVEAKKTEIWERGGGAGSLALTREQADAAVAAFKTRFIVQAAAA